MPGQSDLWYQRIATEIAAGRMPLPQLPEPEPVVEAIAVAVAPPRFVVVAEAVPLAAVTIPSPPPQPVAVAVAEPPETPFSPPEPPKAPAPSAPPGPEQKSPVPLQASQHQLEQAAKSARAKAPQRSKTQRPKTHPPRELITRLGGDYRGADRLFLKVSLQNPGRDERWVWDKCLWDLHRDRM
jgi:hypothetical protein